jgi:hypothetical protein
LALHDFPAQADGDLSFEQGQLIQLLEQVDDGWLKGSVDGREGIFPASFVEVVKDLSRSDPVAPAEPESELPPRPAVASPPASLGTVTALHDFPGGEASDLAFVAGESITLLKRIDPNWLQGRIGDREGSFPQGFVDMSGSSL